jgi:hypothetical protein
MLSWVLATPLSVLGAEPGRASEAQPPASLYRDGMRHYDLAEYDEAIACFKQAFRLSGAVELLFDIAQALRKKGPGSCAAALDFYDSYLRAEREASRRARAEPLRAEVEPCARREREALETPPDPKPGPSPAAEAPAQAPSASDPQPAVTTVTTTTQPASAGRSSALTWWLVGAGAGLAAGGGVLAWSVGWSAGCKPFCSPGQVNELRARAYSGYALIALGTAAAVVGIVLWVATALAGTF